MASSIEKRNVKLEMGGVTPMLKTRDMQATIRFYTETLGFVVANQINNDDGKIRWCALEWGDASVMFYSADDLDSPPGPPAMTGVLYFSPKNVQTVWAELKDKAPVEWELQEMSYGMTEFAIRDCNGYILSFGQGTAEASGANG